MYAVEADKLHMGIAGGAMSGDVAAGMDIEQLRLPTG